MHYDEINLVFLLFFNCKMCIFLFFCIYSFVEVQEAPCLLVVVDTKCKGDRPLFDF